MWIHERGSYWADCVSCLALSAFNFLGFSFCFVFFPVHDSYWMMHHYSWETGFKIKGEKQIFGCLYWLCERCWPTVGYPEQLSWKQAFTTVWPAHAVEPGEMLGHRWRESCCWEDQPGRDAAKLRKPRQRIEAEARRAQRRRGEKQPQRFPYI